MNIKEILKGLSKEASDRLLKTERKNSSNSSWILEFTAPEDLKFEGSSVASIQYWASEALTYHKLYKSQVKCSMDKCQMAIFNFDKLDTMLLDMTEVFEEKTEVVITKVVPAPKNKVGNKRSNRGK